MTETLLKIAWNAAFVAGALLVVYGVGLIYRPAAFIVGGLALAVLSFLGGFDQARNWQDED